MIVPLETLHCNKLRYVAKETDFEDMSLNTYRAIIKNKVRNLNNVVLYIFTEEELKSKLGIEIV